MRMTQQLKLLQISKMEKLATQSKFLRYSMASTIIILLFSSLFRVTLGLDSSALRQAVLTLDRLLLSRRLTPAVLALCQVNFDKRHKNKLLITIINLSR